MPVSIDGATFNRRVKVTVQASQVSGSPTGFPLVIPRSKLPDEMFDSDGSYPTQSDGRDVRCALNDDATGRLAMFVDGWSTATDPANGTGTIYCANAGITSAGNVDVWVFYNSSTATMPAVDSTYGQHNVFDATVLTSLPMSEASGNVLDRTSNGNDGTSSGDTSVAAVVGNGRSFDGVNDSITHAVSLSSASVFTIDALVKRSSNSTTAIVFDQGTTYANRLELYMHSTTDKLWVLFDTAVYGSTNTTFNDTNWHHVALTFDGSGVGNSGRCKIYVDGVDRAITFNGTIPAAVKTLSGPAYIARSQVVSASYSPGTVDEYQVHNAARSSDWLATRSAMLLDPGNFFTLGTPEGDVGGGGTFKSAFYRPCNYRGYPC